MPDLTPREVAEELQEISQWEISHTKIKALQQAAADERRIASGELKPVVHGYYNKKNKCSICDAPCQVFIYPRKPAEPICWNCGALMGKDDSNV